MEDHRSRRPCRRITRQHRLRVSFCTEYSPENKKRRGSVDGEHAGAHTGSIRQAHSSDKIQRSVCIPVFLSFSSRNG